MTQFEYTPPFTTDFWGFYKALVTQAKISPIDSWSLDYAEIYTILEIESKQNSSDISMMINHERRANVNNNQRYLVQ